MKIYFFNLACNSYIHYNAYELLTQFLHFLMVSHTGCCMVLSFHFLLLSRLFARLLLYYIFQHLLCYSIYCQSSEKERIKRKKEKQEGKRNERKENTRKQRKSQHERSNSQNREPVEMRLASEVKVGPSLCFTHKSKLYILFMVM